MEVITEGRPKTLHFENFVFRRLGGPVNIAHRTDRAYQLRKDENGGGKIHPEKMGPYPMRR